MEEAATRCGGAAALQKAVDEGRVVKATHKGVELYYFPQVTEVSTTKTCTRAKVITQETFDDVATTIASLGWQIGVGPACLDSCMWSSMR